MAEVEVIEEVPVSSPEVVEVKAPAEPVESEAAADEANEIPPAVSDHKRKHEDVEAEAVEAAVKVELVVSESDTGADGSDGAQGVTDKDQEIAEQDVSAADGGGDAKRQCLDEAAGDLAADGDQQVQDTQATVTGNGLISAADDLGHPPAEGLEKPATVVSQQDETLFAGQQQASDIPTSSRKIEVPNNKVGVLIGKAGETIRLLQYNSGAKIQITRDADADPSSTTRPVELIGTVESINKAEQLIKDVIAEADAGGSPALVARGFGTAQSGAEQLEIRVPNEKVGLIIGKGGETIKNLQTRSGARIQLIPQRLPDGDESKERTVRISGNKKQIDNATEMIKEVMHQIPGRPSPLSGGYNQQGFRPRGPTAPPQWGPRAMPPSQPSSYDYQQRGTYPSQTPQYPQAYGGYPQQPPPRGSFAAGWDQRPPAQAPPQAGGYDYYGHGGPPTDTQPSGPPAPAAAPGPVNYYGQPQGTGYGQPTPYPQPVPSQQSYGPGYSEPKYDAQAPTQQVYGQQPVSSQPGPYAQQPGAPQTYQQQPYNKPAYGGVPSQAPPQSYGPPRASQPGDPMYQGTAQPNYGSGAPSQQPYPYGSGGPQVMPAYNQQPYGATPATADGYMQQPSAGYPQQGGQVACTQGGQAAPMYPQSGQSAGYGQYPPSQPGYGDQSVTSNAGYAYQGALPDASYGNSTPSTGYGVAPPAAGQAGYVQPPANPSGYEQSVPPQSGYASYTGGAPVGYT